MAEPQAPDPEKQRKSRSFGSFLLFLFVLVLVVGWYGQASMSPDEDLSQDQYLWHLYSGNVVSQKFHGNENGANDVEGYFVDPVDESKKKKFKTSFTAVQPNEDLFRELKAAGTPRAIDSAELRRAIEEDWYAPTLARSLTGYRVLETKTERAGAGAPPTEVQTTKRETKERLIVEVVARSQDAWQAGHPGTEAPFPLPEVSGHQWLEVDLGGVDNLAALIGELKTAGAEVERHVFDLTQDRGSKFSDSNSLLTTFLFVYGPWILIFAVFLIVMRQMRSQGGAGGVMSFGRSRAQLYSKENRTNVTFDDVAGANEAKAEVREIVEFLKNPGRFTRIGGRIPRGVLLVGPPGCGKTLLAKAIAGEAEVPFFSISGSDFVEMFVGVGASRVRDLFKQARENSPCIIFLDEIDAVGRRRGSGMGGGHDEREQTLNAILVEMDGFGTDEGIIVIAATNRPDVLDPALLRPGRFDREVAIELPDLEGREQILEVHLKRVKTGNDVVVSTLARSTPGYSGADLAAIVNEAAIMAVLAKREEILMEDLEEARDKVRYGRQRMSRRLEEDDRKITAYHEAGHAIVAAVIPEIDKPHKITIVPRGRALGATMVLPERESYHMQKRRLTGQLAMLFGGRVAEAEFCGDISAGASDDIRRATDLARAMVTELGMSEKIGPINYAERQGSDFLGTELMRGKTHSEETAREIDQEVRQMLDDAYQRAVEVIRSHRAVIEEMAAALLSWETLSRTDVDRLVAGASHHTLRPAKPQGGPEERTAAGRVAPGKDAAADGSKRSGELPGNPGLSPA